MDEQPLCTTVFADRYARPGETTRAAVFRRVAHALSLAEPVASRAQAEHAFVRNLQRGAIGAGRILANAGAGTDGTMVNCFVHPLAMPDEASAHAVDVALAHALDEARITLLMGGGVGYDFSQVPPAGAYERHGTNQTGACAAIDRFDAMCRILPFTGPRRGAQMGVLRCDHPDLLAFVTAKHGRRRWSTFNLSVGVTDAFMEAVVHNQPWTLAHRVPPLAGPNTPAALPAGRHAYASVPARTLWQAIVSAARDSSEPGLLFLDTIRDANPLRQHERIDATNPCGEQPLPAYGSCVLGPIDLSRLVRHPFGIDGEPRFDFALLAELVRVQVRVLDNVLDLTAWPLAAHAREAHAKRRIGVGVTGLADALTMLRLRYDSTAARMVAREIALTMRQHAFAASAALAAERGAFPAYDPADYLDGPAHRAPLPLGVHHAIARHGLRNSHLLSFAPTGSVSLAFCDNCSNGIEPAVGWVQQRYVRTSDDRVHVFRVENHSYRLFRQLRGSSAALPDYFVTAAQVAPADHVAMLAALQPCVDAGISKTVAVDQRCSLSQVDALFLLAWRERLKGITIFRPDPQLASVVADEAANRAGQPACITC
ncbi:adenosylcobalamin-dependent ribonucleoside-diphosphate reductase [Burkholderia ubonensis]|uniref:adenosylcobalamin-dependent ribonucleoside-diphosphate reductase n=1 Tax=Burkholderia ubonensis TaxID=101571 RepID=UPI000F589D9C|nr:adenosylcobalamin-dependent ribonucleoside-diphosphate reductase [Burkholderia ubonensis]RQP27051.1 adenosylcobalamin-dependent ribonucleoside-diphosphate reductase [Burkholderia ubonensis]RQP28626.1 adenosylcobalamin-dependent ribonucleoside-diphosphate reductase [Burkholderia ubonensis]RQP29525.1 adenosylcobalamin-dependent ribonucleoside-diphosphate reductase [Burkholderia ubonensis]RQP45988.1 adenosylcobalamin-dependent ribonucleoside-diphosphate reductase [Burkholderia ubonensis]RQP488